ncbi:MAG TPA: replication-associated recombination protein A [Nitrospirae bacterium]|nr:replication-associated recombination protein A [bacterium BMS3Abin06]HDH11147.1 replication-associated recombination protein A [Nitrospirota bacterium]HDZ02626.1 replication-associated recombination protein A [Nitrospirota bacterium]
MELFKQDRRAPLAWRMQPRNLDEFVGQSHILGQGKPLREAIERDSIVSLILYGPPGTGKTALAHIIAQKTRAFFISLNAVTSGVGEIKEALKDAKKADRVILFVDEIHRFNKLQQDALLPDVENGTVTLIGASTRNPFFSIIPALSSRSMIFQFFPLSEPEIKILLERALQDREKGVGDLNIKIEPGALDFIATASEGDARRALNTLEMGAFMIKSTKRPSYDIELAKEVLQKKSLYYSEDEHYDTISAFIKSMRGGDPDAVLYWLAKMIEAGEDPLYIARRIIICASEDVGNADPGALQVAVAAMHAVEFTGMPEARIPLAQAAIYIAIAPKSNASYSGIERALSNVREERLEPVPAHLKGTGYKGASRLGAGAGYKYPHDYKGENVDQQYITKKNIFFFPSDEGYERTFKKRLCKRRSR